MLGRELVRRSLRLSVVYVCVGVPSTKRSHKEKQLLWHFGEEEELGGGREACS